MTTARGTAGRTNVDASPALCRIVIAILTFSTFAPVLKADLGAWDDDKNLTANPLMNPPTWRGVARYWSAPADDLYVPVTRTVWLAIGAATWNGSLKPLWFHLANLALHATAAVVAFGLIRRLAPSVVAAALGALVFALHPVQTESIAWASGLKDVLAGLFALMTIDRFIAAGSGRGIAIATGCFALAVLSKPSAVVVVPITIVIDLFVMKRSMRDEARRIGPILVIAVAAAIVARLAQPATTQSIVAILHRPLIALDSIAFYMGKLVWPMQLAVDYGRTPQYVLRSGAIGWTWLVPLAVAAVCAVFWRRDRRPAIAAMVFLFSISPMLGLVPFDFQTYSTVADHYLYLAMLGPALLVAWLAHNRIARCVVIGAIVAFAALSFAQTHTWRDTRSIATQTLRVNPDSFWWNHRLAVILLKDGDPMRAIDLLDRAVRAQPAFGEAWLTRGEALLRLGRRDEAAESFGKARMLSPFDDRPREALRRMLGQ